MKKKHTDKWICALFPVDNELNLHGAENVRLIFFLHLDEAAKFLLFSSVNFLVKAGNFKFMFHLMCKSHYFYK